MRIVDQIVAAYDRAVAGARRRSRAFEHAWTAKDRFTEAHGGRLAAAISYYGFFAAFALVVVVYSILGRVVGAGTNGFVGSVDGYLSDTLPWVVGTAEQVGRSEVTVIGSVALVLAGVGWVEALRSSQRAVWRLREHPGNWVVRHLIDLGMLVGLGVLLALSLAMAALFDFMLSRLAPDTSFGDTLIRSSGPVLELFVNVMLAAAMLAAVPRLRLSPRRLIPPALVLAVGIQLLNTAGRWFIALSERRPAYYLVAGAVGLLAYLYLLNRLILFGAALAATATGGSVRDLAAAPARRDDATSADPAGVTSAEASAVTSAEASGVTSAVASGVDSVGEPHGGVPSQPR